MLKACRMDPTKPIPVYSNAVICMEGGTSGKHRDGTRERNAVMPDRECDLPLSHKFVRDADLCRFRKDIHRTCPFTTSSPCFVRRTLALCLECAAWPNYGIDLPPNGSGTPLSRTRSMPFARSIMSWVAVPYYWHPGRRQKLPLPLPSYPIPTNQPPKRVR